MLLNKRKCALLSATFYLFLLIIIVTLLIWNLSQSFQSYWNQSTRFMMLFRSLKSFVNSERKFVIPSCKYIHGSFSHLIRRPFSSGPDRILEADKECSLQWNTFLWSWSSQFTTIRPDEPVRIRESFGSEPGSNKPARSVWSMLEETVARAPHRMALTVKREGEWRSWTYHQYQAEIVTVAKAFISLGLAPHHSVGILGESLGDTDERNTLSLPPSG